MTATSWINEGITGRTFRATFVLYAFDLAVLGLVAGVWAVAVGVKSAIEMTPVAAGILVGVQYAICLAVRFRGQKELSKGERQKIVVDLVTAPRREGVNMPRKAIMVWGTLGEQSLNVVVDLTSDVEEAGANTIGKVFVAVTSDVLEWSRRRSPSVPVS